MRTPSERAKLYDFWRAALKALGTKDNLKDAAAAGVDIPPITEEPQCGFYKRRLVKGGPWVPVRYFLEQRVSRTTGELVDDERLRCQVGATFYDPTDVAIWFACCERPIFEADYRALVERGAWAKQYDRRMAEAHEEKPVDWLTVELDGFVKQKRKRTSKHGKRPKSRAGIARAPRSQ